MHGHFGICTSTAGQDVPCLPSCREGWLSHQSRTRGMPSKNSATGASTDMALPTEAPSEAALTVSWTFALLLPPSGYASERGTRPSRHRRSHQAPSATSVGLTATSAASLPLASASPPPISSPLASWLKRGSNLPAQRRLRSVGCSSRSCKKYEPTGTSKRIRSTTSARCQACFSRALYKPCVSVSGLRWPDILCATTKSSMGYGGRSLSENFASSDRRNVFCMTLMVRLSLMASA
mmetsp:Transcript_32277/g.57070  ORF Transcript_32277/g.57070 Transcript_32277/m.57070 type:complete len:236 (+) Transcript_32277:94-801(+)